VEVRVPAAAARLRQAFGKLRLRAAIDFPALNLAVAFALDEQGGVRGLRAAVSALAARPLLLRGLEDLDGCPADESLARELGRRAVRPASWRKVEQCGRRSSSPARVGAGRATWA